ncbi:MAG: glyoxylate/hydroxypyruvate reductase A [Pelagibacteraceae bacterium]|nr:glyoxylate/hydroxypyruvate reductase A [Pelagibacteraceae bacterium]
MSIVFYCNWPNKKEWIKGLRKKFTKEKIQVWPNIKNRDEINYAIVWKMPHKELKKFKNLKIIFSLGAGVDHLINKKDLPKIPIVRIKDPVMRERMYNYVLCHILNYQLKIFDYLENKKNKRWKERFDILDNNDLNVGILGLGYLGGYIAKLLKKNNYKISGFSRTNKTNKYNFSTYRGSNGLNNFLKKLDIVINLLPNTTATQNFVDAKVLKKMKKNCLLINVGRGSTMNEKDLIKHMKKNKNFEAVLDVFKVEPLPKKHGFWKTKNIFITPHSSSITNVDSAIQQIYLNYNVYKKQKKIRNRVNYLQQY